MGPGSRHPRRECWDNNLVTPHETGRGAPSFLKAVAFAMQSASKEKHQAMDVCMYVHLLLLHFLSLHVF